MPLPVAVERLVAYIFDSPSDPLAISFAGWVRASPRFRTFAEGYRDKIRKKARTVQTPEGREDLRFELQVASWLIARRHCTVEYEKYAAGKQRGPDFTITFRTHTLFNVEVTRLRPAAGQPGDEESAGSSRIIRSVCAKLGQMLPGAINLLVLGAPPPYTGENLTAAMRLLLQRAESKDEPFLAQHGFRTPRDFFKDYLRLSAIAMWSAPDGAEPTSLLWLNPQARHPLPKEIATILGR